MTSTHGTGPGDEPVEPARPSRRLRSRHTPVHTAVAALLAALAVVVLLIGGAVAWHLVKGSPAPVIRAAASAPRSTSPARTTGNGSTAPAAAAAAKVCNGPTDVSVPFSSASLPSPVSATTYWLQAATDAQQTHLGMLIYGGTGNGATNSDMENWVNMVQRHCVAAGISVGGFYQSGGLPAVTSVVQALHGMPDVQRYYVNVDDINSTPGAKQLSQVDAVVATIHANAPGVTVILSGDLVLDTSTVTDTVTSIQLFTGDVKTVAFFPWTGSHGRNYYGSVADMSLAGQADAQLSNTQPIAVVQAFNYWQADPGDAAFFKFSHRLIGTGNVVHMATLALQGGAKSILLIELEKRSDSLTVVRADFVAIVSLLRGS